MLPEQDILDAETHFRLRAARGADKRDRGVEWLAKAAKRWRRQRIVADVSCVLFKPCRFAYLHRMAEHLRMPKRCKSCISSGKSQSRAGSLCDARGRGWRIWWRKIPPNYMQISAHLRTRGQRLMVRSAGLPNASGLTPALVVKPSTWCR